MKFRKVQFFKFMTIFISVCIITETAAFSAPINKTNDNILRLPLNNYQFTERLKDTQRKTFFIKLKSGIKYIKNTFLKDNIKIKTDHLKHVVLILFCLNWYYCAKPTDIPKLTPEEYIETKIVLLDRFMGTVKDSTYHTLNRDSISQILYDIKLENGHRRGKAVHLGDNYFLTVYHVVKEKNNLELIPQRGGKKIKFTIVAYDPTNDIALLEAENNIIATGMPKIFLEDDDLEIGTLVSYFQKISPLRTDYNFTLEGKDWYNIDKDTLVTLGRFISPANTGLYETEGRVLDYEQLYYIRQSGPSLGESHEFISSIMTYPGYSGGGVFIKLPGDKFNLSGIAKASYELEYSIETPGNPVRHKEYPQTAASVVSGKAIKTLIQSVKNRLLNQL